MMAIWLHKRRPEVGCMAASHADTGWDDSLTFRLLGNGDEACFGSFKLQFTLGIFVWSCLCLAIHRVLPQWKTHLESQINLKYVITIYLNRCFSTSFIYFAASSLLNIWIQGEPQTGLKLKEGDFSHLQSCECYAVTDGSRMFLQRI